MKRRTFISLMGVMAAAGVLSLTGCSSKDTAASTASSAPLNKLDSIQKSGKLVVALEGAWQPWSYHDSSDTLVGYDVEVSRAIAEKLGVEPEYVESDWDSLFAGLDAGRYDMVCNGVEVTEERAKTGLQEMGLFSYSSIQFTPRSVQTLDSLGNVVYRDTLDANIDLVFDKPYDFYVEANARGKTTGRVGPELVVGLTKRNAFHGGEKLTVNLHGSHEWQTISQAGGGSTRINSYEYGSDVSVEFPRIITPWNMFRTMEQNERRYRAGHMPTRYRGVPTTTIKASMNVLNRASYFRRHVAAGELTYAWSTSYQHQHSFSPLILSYEFMNSRTAAFDSILTLHPYLQISMRDQFVPKMSYTYTYRSPRRYRHPITWSTTISEAANIL